MKLVQKITTISAICIAIGITACNNTSNNDGETSSPGDSSSVPADINNQYPASADNQTVTPADTVVDSSHLKPVDTSTLKKSGAMRKKGSVKTKQYAVDKKVKMEADVAGVYPYAEVMPSFPGGEKALEKWIEENIKYPEPALDNNTEGDVTVAFAVDETGKVYTPKITSPKIGDGLEEEALAIVSKMPKWNPGRIKGKNVKTMFTLPVSFQLQ